MGGADSDKNFVALKQHGSLRRTLRPGTLSQMLFPHKKVRERKPVHRMHEGLSRIAPEPYLHRVKPSQPLRPQRYPFRLKKAADELHVLISHCRRAKTCQHVCTAERLCDESMAIRAQLHQCVDQQLHGMHTEAGRFSAVLRGRKKNMIHAPNPGDRIMKADRNAGAEQRFYKARLSTGPYFADGNTVPAQGTERRTRRCTPPYLRLLPARVRVHSVLFHERKRVVGKFSVAPEAPPKFPGSARKRMYAACCMHAL
jgi:hypothetical protein